MSCSQKPSITIAISKASGSKNYELYSKWLKSTDDNISVVDLYGLSYDEAIKELEKCDGLVLSGGPDVHPVFFNKSFDTARCSIENYRDTLEFELIKKSELMKIPVLAICRGAQIINVAYGGDLIIDIPEDTKSAIKHQISNEDAFHEISISEGSILHKISGSLTGLVNSNHHQSVDRLSNKYVIVAKSNDGIIEAFENKDKLLPYFMAVQWHPERLETNSKFSRPIAESFLKEVIANFHNNRLKK